MEITLTISQNGVLKEVAQKTSYAGGKLQDNPKMQDPDALDRIATVDEDDNELKTFWDECRAELVKVLSSRLVAEGYNTENTDNYYIKLNLWDGFNATVVPALEIELFNYFVYGIIARWYMYTQKEEASVYATLAASNLDDIVSTTIQRYFTRKMHPF